MEGLKEQLPSLERSRTGEQTWDGQKNIVGHRGLYVRTDLPDNMALAGDAFPSPAGTMTTGAGGLGGGGSPSTRAGRTVGGYSPRRGRRGGGLPGSEKVSPEH